MDVKISKNINDLTRNKEEFEEFYETLSFEERQELDKAEKLEDFIKVLEKHEELSDQEVDQLFEFRKDKIELEKQQSEQASNRSTQNQKNETNQTGEAHDHERSASQKTTADKTGSEKDEVDKYLEEQGIKNPDKSHRSSDEMSSEEFGERMTNAKENAPVPSNPSGDNQIIIPEGAIMQERKPKATPPDAQTTTVVKRRVSIPTSTKITTRRSSFPGRPGGPMPARRVKRRSLGAVGKLSKRAISRGSKKAAVAAGRAALTNPWVLGILAIVGGLLFLLVFIFIVIRSACDASLFDQVTDPFGTGALAIVGHATGICSNSLDGTTVKVPPNPPGVLTFKPEPYAVGNEENIAYEITVKYDPSIDNAITESEFSGLSLFDVPLYDFAYVSSTGESAPGTGSDERSFIQWKMSDNPECINSWECTFQLIVDPEDVDFIAKNAVYVSDSYQEVSVTGGVPGEDSYTSSGSEPQPCKSRDPSDIWYGADCPASNNYCQNNKYKPRIDETITWIKTGINPSRPDLGKQHSGENPDGNGGNFGDPVCSYRLAKANKIIDELALNEQRADFWKEVIRCEGGVNSYGRQVHSTTGRPNGPAGMFQMNIGNPIFSTWNARNTLRGDVPWQRQIQNAIANNNEDRDDGNDFGFYGSAMCLCWWPEHRDKGYCADIRAKGLDDNYGPRAPLNNCPTNTGWKCDTAYRCENNSCRPQ